MKSILITGGAGFFGQGFVSYLLEHEKQVDRICIYSRGEHRQAAMREAIPDPDERIRYFIGDVRDRDRLRRAMSGVEVVVHAAALKRIEVGAYNPIEMVNTNVLGAINVIEAARDARVSKVVALSTDKAYQPISPYGYSKAMAEALFLAANDNHGTQFAVTRYGNVAGSDGSVIPKWRQAIAEKRMFSITYPKCTRFWMTLQQAIELVWSTINTMNGGETVIPQLPAFNILDLAIALRPLTVGSEYGYSVSYELPAWEKKHESMAEGNCSKDARRMTVEELREALKQV